MAGSLGFAALAVGMRGRLLVRRRAADALPLRRQGPPGRGPPDRRQPHAGLDADRRRLAAAAAPDQLLPVQWDFFYRTGAFGVGLSVLAFAATRLADRPPRAGRRTGSRARGGGRARPCCRLNPNVLYLQSTPMTEPLLMALTTAAVWLGDRGRSRRETAVDRPRAGLALAAACSRATRPGPFTAALLALGLRSPGSPGPAGRAALPAIGRLAAYPAAAVAGVPRAEPGDRRRVVREVAGSSCRRTRDLHRPCRPLVSVWWGAPRAVELPARARSAPPGSLLPASCAAFDHATLAPWLPVAGAGRRWRPAVVRVLLGAPVPHPLHDPAHSRGRPRRRVRRRPRRAAEAARRRARLSSRRS